MSNQSMNIYEGMFLFPQAAAGNLKAASDHVTEILDRAGAEVVSLAKWDERRLAYEIKGNKRGVYFLAYFKAAPTAIAALERDCNLSEQVLRAMFLRADKIPAEAIEAADGRAKLADEIKLRGEQAAAGREGQGAERVVVTSGPKEEAKPEAKADAPAESAAEAPAEKPEEAPSA